MLFLSMAFMTCFMKGDRVIELQAYRTAVGRTLANLKYADKQTTNHDRTQQRIQLCWLYHFDLVTGL